MVYSFFCGKIILRLIEDFSKAIITIPYILFYPLIEHN